MQLFEGNNTAAGSCNEHQTLCDCEAVDCIGDFIVISESRAGCEFKSLKCSPELQLLDMWTHIAIL